MTAPTENMNGTDAQGVPLPPGAVLAGSGQEAQYAAPAPGPVGTPDEITIEPEFFGFDETKRWYFPGSKVQYIEYKAMTEGMRRDYQKRTNHSVTITRSSGDAKMGIDPAGDRTALLDISVVGWHVLREGQPVNFTNSQHGFKKWLEGANPKYVEMLEREIRKSNEWMQAEMTAEAIRDQIEQLKSDLVEAERREAGE
jgi:hypothetical protein